MNYSLARKKKFGINSFVNEHFTMFKSFLNIEKIVECVHRSQSITQTNPLFADSVLWSKHALEESLTFHMCSGRSFLISPLAYVSEIFRTSLRTSVNRTVSAEKWRWCSWVSLWAAVLLQLFFRPSYTRVIIWIKMCEWPAKDWQPFSHFHRGATKLGSIWDKIIMQGI